MAESNSARLQTRFHLFDFVKPRLTRWRWGVLSPRLKKHKYKGLVRDRLFSRMSDKVNKQTTV